MATSLRLFAAFAVCLLACATALPAEQASALPVVASAGLARKHTVAVLRSEEGWFTGPLDVSLRRSIMEMAEGRAPVQLFDEARFDGRAGDAGLRAAFSAALADPSVDFILISGARAAALAGDPAFPLSKPVIGAALVDPDLVPLPVDGAGRSSKTNYMVVSLAPRTVELLRQYRQVQPFSSVQVLADERTSGGSAALEAWRARLSIELGCAVRVIAMGSEIDAVLSQVDPAAGPVCLMPVSQLDEARHAALIEGLRSRKVAVLSFAGQAEVEAGTLAGFLPEARVQLARRVAVVFDQIVSGIATSSIVLQAPPSLELFLNETTAASIGVSPSFDVLNTATLVSPYQPEAGKVLSLGDALALSLQKNPLLRARQAGTEASRQDVRAATGTILPQLAAVANYQQIDGDRARASGGLYPEKTLVAGFALTQTLFDDEANTRISQARAALRAANASERVQKLDTAATAGQAYLQYLSARAALRVTEQNARTTRKHLELANLRQRVGTSGPEDIFRFEALMAQQRSEVINARMQVERSRTGLNRALGVDVALQWSPRDVALDDPVFSGCTAPLLRLVGDQSRFDRLRAYLVSYAATHSPDIEAVEHGVAAQRLAAEQKGRRSYVPKLAATANIGHLAEQDYGGPTLVEQLRHAGLPVPASDLDRTVWTVGVQATLPLFTGGSLTADTRKARAQLRQMEGLREATTDAVVAQTQAALYATMASYNNIALSATAAELASRNLGVVQQKYEQGTVSIVTLLDAQTTAFAQRQAAEVAVYRFFGDVIQLQRLFGWVEPLATPEENAAWLREVEAAVSR